MSKKTHWGVECPDCKTRLFSHFRHDYKTCGCPNETMVDGGYDYMRCGGHKKPIRIDWDTKIDGKLPKIKDTSSWPY